MSKLDHALQTKNCYYVTVYDVEFKLQDYLSRKHILQSYYCVSLSSLETYWVFLYSSVTEVCTFLHSSKHCMFDYSCVKNPISLRKSDRTPLKELLPFLIGIFLFA